MAIDPLEEMKAIDQETQEDIRDTHITWELIGGLVVLAAMLFALCSCDNIQPRCFLANTNEKCSIILIGAPRSFQTTPCGLH